MVLNLKSVIDKGTIIIEAWREQLRQRRQIWNKA